jgi:hypothetical protein
MDSEITPEAALAAVKAAGLDPDRALSEQVEQAAPVDESTVRGWVSEAVAEARPASPQEQAQRFAEDFRDKLVEAQSPWFSLDGSDAG